LADHGVKTAATELFDARAAVSMVASLIGNLAGVMWSLGIALIVAFFLLLRFGGNDDSRASRGLMGSERVSRTFREVNRYIAVKTLTSMVTGLLVGCLIWILDGELAALFGLVAFLLNYIPNLGSIIASIPAILLGYVSGGPGHGTLVLLGYVAINVGIGNIMEPRVMGRALGLWPLVTLLSVFFWGWLLGAIGALLSALLTVMVKAVLLALDDLRPIGMMLGPVPKMRGHAPEDEAILEGTLPQTGADKP
jgi:AI-2 transport protein TqsA